MTSAERLQNRQSKLKPSYLIDTKEELISERDRMESNWNESMRPRMSTISKISLMKFGKTISSL